MVLQSLYTLSSKTNSLWQNTGKAFTLSVNLGESLGVNLGKALGVKVTAGGVNRVIGSRSISHNMTNGARAARE